MPQLTTVLKRLEFEPVTCQTESDSGYVFLNPRSGTGRFCYSADEAPVLPIAIIRKRRGRGTKAMLVVTKAQTYLRVGGMVEEDRQLMTQAGCTFVDHQSVEQRFKKVA